LPFRDSSVAFRQIVLWSAHSKVAYFPVLRTIIFPHPASMVFISKREAGNDFSLVSDFFLLGQGMIFPSKLRFGSSAIRIRFYFSLLFLSFGLPIADATPSPSRLRLYRLYASTNYSFLFRRVRLSAVFSFVLALWRPSSPPCVTSLPPRLSAFPLFFLFVMPRRLLSPFAAGSSRRPSNRPFDRLLVTLLRDPLS